MATSDGRTECGATQTPGLPRTAERGRVGRLACAAILVAALLVVYGQVGGHQFLAWDDQQQVVANPLLNPVTPGSVARFWRQPFWGLYIPASYTFFAGEALLSRGLWSDGQLHPSLFHWGNLLLHVGCALVVFSILRRLLGQDLPALGGALLFGLHPLQVESVAWVSEARGLLCGLFALAAIRLYLAARGPGVAGMWCYFLATAAFVLALLAKPAAVAVPLVTLVLELGCWVGWDKQTEGPVGLRSRVRRLFRTTPESRVDRSAQSHQAACDLVPPYSHALRLLLWFLLAGGCAVLTKLQQPDDELRFRVPPAERLLVAGDALTFYLEKLVGPCELVPDYGRTPGAVLGQRRAYCIWLLPVALAAALACLPNRRVWLTAAGLFAAWLLPTLGLAPFVYQRISTVADRYAYLALLGPAFALAWVLARWPRRWVIALAAAGLALLGWFSHEQTACWRDDATLWAHTLSINSASTVANHNAGYALARQGRFAEAEEFYRRVLSIDPGHVESQLNLGVALLARGRLAEAERRLAEAARLKPRWGLVHYYLGELAFQGRHDAARAVDEYRAAIRLEPDCLPAHRSLVRALEALGRDAEARRAREVLQQRTQGSW